MVSQGPRVLGGGWWEPGGGGRKAYTLQVHLQIGSGEPAQVRRRPPLFPPPVLLALLTLAYNDLALLEIL